ncbi:PAAR domain-containing protein [Chromobacterium amazonense]|uniref:PAAR domain-containing protein n=1 Tax=Chromobacterium amazonense TaxID=1382803 RepID=UPI000D0405A1|nr:PAAR domain-containing protein [Chromobacterium amazonense]
MKKVIRIGDPTDHGGSVTSATSSTNFFGKNVAVVGDSVSCPKDGHVNCVIVEGDPSWSIGGKAVALEGHSVSCGAKLISTLGQVTRSYDGSGAATTGLSAVESLAVAAGKPLPPEKFNQHFQVVDQDGKPVSDFPVHLEMPDGSISEVKTSAAGKTEIVGGEAGQKIGLHLFKD